MHRPAGPVESRPQQPKRGPRWRVLRSAAISFAALLVLVAGFSIYWWWQPAVPGSSASLSASYHPVSPKDLSNMPIGPGDRPWVDNYSNGVLSSKFHARQFTPAGHGNYNVDQPIWVFYLSDGQYLLLTGDSAMVHVDSAGEGTPESAGGGPAPTPAETATISPSFMQMPSSGTLQNVRASLFPNTAATRPTLTLTTNNLAFDHDTLRLYTQAFTDPSGQLIPADRVPVVVRGDDYDFDGDGLSMHWDDRDHRLQLLEIEHGRRLVIKHPSKLSTPMGAPAAAARDNGPVGAPIVDAGPGAAKLALAAPAHGAAASAPVVYRAIFNELVRVWQGQQQMATADTMTVDFISGGKKAGPATAPAAPPTDEQPLVIQPPAPAAAMQAVAGTAPTSAPASAPASATAEPVTVQWVGKLRLTPIEEPPILPLIAGQAVVRLVGSPVVLTPKGSLVHAAAVVYRSGDAAGRLENSAAVPMIDVHQDRGLSFTSESASYDPATAWATIVGRSHLSLPLEGSSHNVMTATWNQLGKIHVLAKNGSPDSVDHVDLLGDVKVGHPQFNLSSSQLSLDLEQAKRPTTRASSSASQSTQLNLKRATAVGDVVCRLPVAGQQPRGIDSDRLVIEMKNGRDGKPTPHTVVADGSVRAFNPQDEEELRAGHLEAVLAETATSPTTKPTTQPSETMAVQSLYARSAVHAILKGGATADADELRLTTPGGRQHVELRGTGGQLASVSDATRGTLRGPILQIDPDRSAIAVDGPGSIHTDRRTSATQPSQPVDVTWNHDLAMDESANTVDVHGNVIAKLVDAQGDHNQIVGDNAHINLMDAPTTRPTTQPTEKRTQAATTRPNGQPNKQIRDLAIRGHVIASSLLLAPDRTTVWRRGVMDADEMDYDQPAGRGLVPGPGRMLVEDHRPQNAAANGAGDTGNQRGALAIQWRDSLQYLQGADQVVFNGDVRTVFRQDQKNAQKMELDCDHLTADMTTTPPAGHAVPTTAPARTQLSRITAAGSAHFAAKGLDVTAGRIVYDPTTSHLIASATPGEPGHFVNDQGQSTGSFKEVIYDTASQTVVSESGVIGSVQR